MVDNCEIRHGKISWFKLDEVSSAAVNDVQLLMSAPFLMLKRFFGHLPCCKELYEEFHECGFFFSMGQNLDFLLGKSNVENITLKTHALLTMYKVSPLMNVVFVCPMILAG